MPTIRKLLDVLTALGLTSGLQVCLDAGDSASYSGSGQTFTDRSGQGNSFFRGSTSSSESSDPTFAGSAGGLSINEKFTFDGGDALRLGQTNPTWVNNLHKAGAKYTWLIGWKYKVPGSTEGILGTSGAAGSNVGILALISGATKNISITCGNGSSTILNAAVLTMPAVDTVSITAASIDEAAGAGGSFVFQNGAATTFNAAYASPSAGAASATLELMARGAVSQPIASGSELHFVAIWESVALSQADVTAIYNEMGLRLGIVAGGDAALSGDSSLTASGRVDVYGSCSLSAGGNLTCSGSTEAPEEPEEVPEPIFAVAVVPVSAVEEPTAPEEEDLLRLNNSAVIDYVYLLELRPFAPAGTSLPA